MSPYSVRIRLGMQAAQRGLTLGLAFLGAQLRRLPGAGLVERFTSLILTVLLVGALVSLAVWAAQKSPQRISLAELEAGALSPMQSWIIVSGDVRFIQHGATGYVYLLTDPAAPNASLTINSEVELSEGATTVSGTLLGGDARAPQGFAWLGHLRADPFLASEQSPPWIAIAFAFGGALVGLLAWTFYPVFFRDEPLSAAAPPRRLAVRVHRAWPPTHASVPGTLELELGATPELRAEGGATRELRVHSATSGFEVARLRWLTGSEPLLVIRAVGGDVTLGFASTAERDGAYAALVASAPLGLRRSPKGES